MIGKNRSVIIVEKDGVYFLSQKSLLTMTSKLIAFRTIDADRDIWCERCFLFQNEDEVNDFFQPANKDLMDLFTDEETGKELRDFTLDKVSAKINYVRFNTEYAGDVSLCRMYGGYIPALPF